MPTPVAGSTDRPGGPPLGSSPVVPNLRARLARGEFLVGTWLTFLEPNVAELLAGSGYDFLVVDMEHGVADAANLQAQCIGARAGGAARGVTEGTAVLARIGANEPVRIMHALDVGAAGVIVPQIRSVADAERAVAWCRYPPTGLRGAAGRRSSDYGRAVKEYFATANETVFCCIQIETSEALEALDGILAVAGVDAVLIGPNDLAAALGHLGETGHPDVEAAVGEVRKRALAAGMPVGIVSASPDPAPAVARKREGYSFVTVGVDFAFLTSGADAALMAMRQG
jgi:2-keto-3-deoxy-L-rhamnonate aldolase RhmA